MNIAKVLVVDQNKGFANATCSYLKEAGFDANATVCGGVALDKIDETEPDILVTDRQLPGMSGIELCRRIRARTDLADLPIIMTAANSDHRDLARALEIGADDFVHKPLNSVELVARARALLRRVRPAAIGQTLRYEDIVVEVETLRAYRDGKLLKIGPTEFQLLATFVERPGRVMSRAQLLDMVWGRSTYVDTRTVDVHVGRLRKNLRLTGEGDPFRTIRGVGYALG